MARRSLGKRLADYDWEPHELRCFKAAKLRTVRDLAAQSDRMLLRIPGVSRGTLRKFEEFLASHGVEMKKGVAVGSGKAVPEGFTMPEAERPLLEALAWRAWRSWDERHAGPGYRTFSKSEVLRAGLLALVDMAEEDFFELLRDIPEGKRGKPSNVEMEMMAESAVVAGARKWPQVEALLASFDFGALRSAMRKLGLRWPTPGGTPRTPTAAELETKAEELLEVAFDSGEASYGGLYAYRRRGELVLTFSPQRAAAGWAEADPRKARKKSARVTRATAAGDAGTPSPAHGRRGAAATRGRR